MILSPRPILALALLAAVLAGLQRWRRHAVRRRHPRRSSRVDGARRVELARRVGRARGRDARLRQVHARARRRHARPGRRCRRRHDRVASAPRAASRSTRRPCRPPTRRARHLMPVRPDGGPAQMTPEQQDAMLAFAKCMREHGVDMPDPEFGTAAAAVMIGGDGIAFDSPTFKAADEACRSIMTDAMPGFVGGRRGPSVSAPGPSSDGRRPIRPDLHAEPAHEAAADRSPVAGGRRRRRRRRGRGGGRSRPPADDVLGSRWRAPRRARRRRGRDRDGRRRRR